MIYIREARRGDEAAVIQVIKAVYDEFGFPWDPDDYHADLYDLEAHYWSHGDAFYLAEIDGIPVGTVAWEAFEPGTTTASGLARAPGCDCSIERMYVIDSARKLGVGSAMFQHVVSELKHRGRKRMEIWSDKEFDAAHRLYQRFGARIIGERLCDDANQSPEWGLVLDLTVNSADA